MSRLAGEFLQTGLTSASALVDGVQRTLVLMSPACYFWQSLLLLEHLLHASQLWRVIVYIP